MNQKGSRKMLIKWQMNKAMTKHKMWLNLINLYFTHSSELVDNWVRHYINDEELLISTSWHYTVYNSFLIIYCSPKHVSSRQGTCFRHVQSLFPGNLHSRNFWVCDWLKTHTCWRSDSAKKVSKIARRFSIYLKLF